MLHPLCRLNNTVCARVLIEGECACARARVGEHAWSLCASHALVSCGIVQVAWLLDWGRATGLNWLQHVTAAPAGHGALPGLSALHLSVLAGESGAAADMLTSEGAYGCSCDACFFTALCLLARGRCV